MNIDPDTLPDGFDLTTSTEFEFDVDPGEDFRLADIGLLRPGGPEPEDPDGEIPRTGSDPMVWLRYAALLLLAGVALILLTMRRRRSVS